MLEVGTVRDKRGGKLYNFVQGLKTWISIERQDAHNTMQHMIKKCVAQTGSGCTSDVTVSHIG